MTQPLLRSATLLAALALAWQPSKASAENEDTQFWLVGFVRGEIGNDVFLTVDTSQRWRDPVVGSDQQTIRVTIEKGLNDDIRIGGGAALFQAGSVSEFRPHQQFRYAKGGLDLRTRFEQRWFDNGDQVELRIRQRVQYTQPLAQKLELVGSAEWFGIIQPRNVGGREGTEQVRALLGVSYAVSDSLEIAPSYLVQLTPRDGRPDAISHIPQLTINYRF